MQRAKVLLVVVISHQKIKKRISHDVHFYINIFMQFARYHIIIITIMKCNTAKL